MTTSKEEAQLAAILEGPHKPGEPRPTSWVDFSVATLQIKRPIAPSTLNSGKGRCLEHKNLQETGVSRWSPDHGNVARLTYQGCECVEYRPIKAKERPNNGNWIVQR